MAAKVPPANHEAAALLSALATKWRQMVATRLTAQFETRRQAEMTVERLVQEYRIDRKVIQVTAAGDANSAGVARAGSDTAAGAPSEPPRDDAALAGAVQVQVDLADEAAAADVRRAFSEFSGDGVAED
jgi:hypothetical protein